MYEPTKKDVRWEWLGEGWNLFTQQWQNWVLLGLVALVLNIIVSAPFYFIMFGAEFAAARAGEDGGVTALSGVASIISRLGLQIASAVLHALLAAGFYKAAFIQLRGGQVSINDLKGVFEHLGPMLGAGIIIGILQSIGLMLCCIPGFIVMGLLMFTYPLIIERNLGMFDAMSTSMDVTKKNLLMFILLAIVVQLLIPLIGIIACGVGLLVAYPLIFLITACAYRDCYGLPGAQSGGDDYAPPPPPSYGDYNPPSSPSSWQ